MSYATTAESLTQSPLAEKRHVERVMRLVSLFGIAASLILGMVYLSVLNRVATRGFDLEAMKGERVAILKQLDAAEIEATLPSSLYGLQISEQFQQMERIGKTQYRTLNQGEMALLSSGINASRF